MKQERLVQVEDTVYRVVISDKTEILLAARAAGKIPVGLLREGGDQDLRAARFLIEEEDSADDRFLERVVRRERGLPWIIGESERLFIREFTLEDICQVIQEAEDQEADRIFYTPDQLSAYIRTQYGFFEYGLWAVIRKADGVLLGKAGVTPAVCDLGVCKETEDHEMVLELGYHIFKPYRRRGYAEEACRLILAYIKEEGERSEVNPLVYAEVEKKNLASKALLEKLGFLRKEGGIDTAPSFQNQNDISSESIKEQRYSGEGLLRFQYEWNWR